MWDDWETHMGPHMGTHFTQLCKWVGADVGSHMDMSTYSDACTYSNSDVGSEEG